MRRLVVTLISVAAAGALTLGFAATAQAAAREYITVATCVFSGGVVVPDWLSPTGRTCVGGGYHGYPVFPY
ncbi:hypothetical protein [Nonomuraea sp. NEAU-A123]|uniref:hypothetical protein n=1 Tax=Nonomuraea sp. NEAU-A123 TaxID=2839649 RepID=UPI001BE3E776|nr:hypothetical protein [Nonomuraea sp. NEAU-A123]MBT2228986.1 hypothetical protein [Nonomuraea sp. NEAU-A123]